MGDMFSKYDPACAPGEAFAPDPSEHAAKVFAGYHAEQAAHRGVSWEFHARAQTHIIAREEEITRLRAALEKAERERDAYLSQLQSAGPDDAPYWGHVDGTPMYGTAVIARGPLRLDARAMPEREDVLAEVSRLVHDEESGSVETEVIGYLVDEGLICDAEERDDAIARAEKAERERDEAFSDGHLVGADRALAAERKLHAARRENAELREAIEKLRPVVEDDGFAGATWSELHGICVGLLARLDAGKDTP